LDGSINLPNHLSTVLIITVNITSYLKHHKSTPWTDTQQFIKTSKAHEMPDQQLSKSSMARTLKVNSQAVLLSSPAAHQASASKQLMLSIPQEQLSTSQLAISPKPSPHYQTS